MARKMRTTAVPLPTTRWELLREVLRYRFLDFIFLSIYLFIFSAPMLLWLIFSNYTPLVTSGSLYGILIVYAILIPCIMFFGLGMGGALYYSKRLCFQEGASVHKDFFDGIRRNWKMFLAIYFVLGLFYFLLHGGLAIVESSESLTPIVKGVLEGLLYAAFIFVFFLMAFVQTETINYQGSFFDLLGNSVKMLFGAGLTNLGIFALVLVPWLVYEFVPSQIAEWIAWGVSGLFYFGFSAFCFSLYSQSVFDKSINKEHYPEMVRKGLAPLEKPGNDR